MVKKILGKKTWDQMDIGSNEIVCKKNIRTKIIILAKKKKLVIVDLSFNKRVQITLLILISYLYYIPS